MNSTPLMLRLAYASLSLSSMWVFVSSCSVFWATKLRVAYGLFHELGCLLHLHFWNFLDHPEYVHSMLDVIMQNILVDSGDTDAVVPVTATRYSIDALKLPTITNYYKVRQSFIGNSIGWGSSRSPPPPSQLLATTRLEEQNDRRTAYDSFGETTDPTSLPGSLSRKTKEQDDSGARTTSCTYGRTEEQPSLHIVLNKSKRTISKGFMEGLEQWELIVMPGRHLVLISTYFWMVGTKMCNGSS
ncbi:hypothetical protein CsSME_00037042 [Camellia sinensis var. sinensis]